MPCKFRNCNCLDIFVRGLLDPSKVLSRVRVGRSVRNRTELGIVGSSSSFISLLRFGDENRVVVVSVGPGEEVEDISFFLARGGVAMEAEFDNIIAAYCTHQGIAAEDEVKVYESWGQSGG